MRNESYLLFFLIRPRLPSRRWRYTPNNASRCNLSGTKRKNSTNHLEYDMMDIINRCHLPISQLLVDNFTVFDVCASYHLHTKFRARCLLWVPTLRLLNLRFKIKDGKKLENGCALWPGQLFGPGKWIRRNGISERYIYKIDFYITICVI